MPKNKTSLQREISNLKKEKARRIKLKRELIARKKEIDETLKLEREIRDLRGVGTKRRLAGQVTKQMGATAGKFAWRGLKVIGRVVKSRIEAEAREQQVEAARAKAKAKPKAKPKRKKKRRSY